jgi:hypothetical protein
MAVNRAHASTTGRGGIQNAAATATDRDAALLPAHMRGALEYGSTEP